MSLRESVGSRLFLGLIGIVFFKGSAFGAGFLDDFNDGNVHDNNPVSWVEDLGGSGLFPGDYNASSGDYVLTPEPDGTDESIMSSFVPTPFADLYIRMQGTILPDPMNPLNTGGNLVLSGRLDPGTLSGYILYFDVSGNLQLQILAGIDTIDIGTLDFVAPFNASSEVNLEMNIVGDELSGFVWPVGEPKPAEPQVTATDTTFTAPGVAGIAFAEDDDGTIGVFRFVAAQDTPFVDAVAGDYDGDDDVDGNDFLVWQQQLGGPGSADGNGSGTVDGADLGIWQTAFSAGGGGVSAVPEPVGLASVFAAVLTAAGAFRKVNRRPTGSKKCFSTDF